MTVRELVGIIGLTVVLAFVAGVFWSLGEYAIGRLIVAMVM
jgi:hypothetical protein